MKKVAKYLILIVVFTIVCISLNAQQSGDLTIGGTFDKFYPVTFQDGAWGTNKMTDLTIGRVDVHENSTWRGSTIAKFTFHTNNGGHGSENIEATMFYNITPFIAGWKDVSFYSSPNIIIWLKGGNTTYHYSANYPVNPVVYDSETGYNEPNSWSNPQTTINRPPKTTLDDYVTTQGHSFTSSINISNGGFLRLGMLYGGPIGSGALINMATGGSNTSIQENWGLNMCGENTKPVKIYNSSLLVGYQSWGADYGQGNLLVQNKVGIGTSTIPSTYSMVVEGKVGVRKLVVTQSPNWADYVFADKYKLLPLQDLETYIKQHQHLPDVPTTEEVSKNGIDIGAMQPILLKKIEELTLYMIDLKKENEMLKKRIIKLEIKNN